MGVGRIITNGKNIERCLSIVEQTSCTDIIPSMPTLIVGKKLAISIFGEDKVKILNKNIEGNVWWTYSRQELRSEYIKGINNFNAFVLEYIRKKITYKYVDVFSNSSENIKRLITFVYSNAPKVFYVTDKMLYIYSKGCTYGVDLRECDYIGISRSKILQKVYNSPNRLYIDNKSFLGNDILEYADKYEYIIPYLFEEYYAPKTKKFSFSPSFDYLRKQDIYHTQ